MKTLEQFEKYYSKELKPEIESIEKEGEKVKRKYSFKSYGIDMVTLVIIIIIIAITRDFVPAMPDFLIPVCVVLTMLYGIIKPIYIFVKRNLVFDQFNLKYKETVAKKLVNFIDSDLKYDASGSLPSDKFMIRTFFGEAKSKGNLISEDLVSGKLDGRNFIMADARVSIGSSNGASSDRLSFEGVYAVVTLKKSFNGTMHLNYINKVLQPLNELNEGAENFRDLINQTLGGLTGKDPDTLDKGSTDSFIPINTSDDSFEKVFKVIGLNTSDCEEILTEKFRKGLLKIVEESGKSIGLTFNGNELHIAILDENLFETDVHSNPSDKKGRFSTHNYYRLFETIDQVIRLVD